MYIKLGPSVSPLGPSQSRVTLPARGTLEAAAPASIRLSEAVRSYAAVMMDLAHASGCEASFHVLLPDDRSVLLFARQLADELGLPPGEVHKLVFDLCMYRLGEPGDEPTTMPGSDGRLALLPALPPADEAEARTILSSLALRDTAIDRRFLGSLLAPERTRVPRVDFTFLRRLVVSSSRSFADGALDPGVSLERRDAQTLLARAVATLAPALVITEQVARQALREGPALLRHLLERPSVATGESPQPPLDLAPLTRKDRHVLGLLYAAARNQGHDQAAVDRLAQALVALRRTERALAGPAQAVAIADPRSAARAVPLPDRPHAQPPRVMGAAPPSDPSAAGEGPGQQPAELMPQRVCESSAQLLSRSVSSYRSVAPPSAQLADGGPFHMPGTTMLSRVPLASGDAAVSAPLLRGTEPAAGELRALASGFHAPLDLAQALGVGALLERVRKRAVLTTPKRSTEPRRAKGEDGERSQAESTEQEPASDSDPSSGRQGRWQLLLVRRQRSRLRRWSAGTS